MKNKDLNTENTKGRHKGHRARNASYFQVGTGLNSWLSSDDRKNLNWKSLYLFVLVISSTSVLLIGGWLIGSVFGGLHALIGGFIGGAVGTVLGGEIGHRKGFFESAWDRLVIGGPWCGYLLGLLIASSVGTQGWIFAVFSVLGAGAGALLAKYLLRFFVHDPPLSIK